MKFRFEFLLLGALLLASAPAWANQMNSNKLSTLETTQQFTNPNNSFDIAHASFFGPLSEHHDWSNSHRWRAGVVGNNQDMDNDSDNNTNNSQTSVATPEPATLLLLGAGLIGLLGLTKLKPQIHRS